MVYNRRGISPWSLEREAGIESATVDSNIEVPQYLQPTVDTGFIDERGSWKGNKSSDEVFKFYQKDEAIANAGTFITAFGLDMTGFNDIQMAIRPTRAGNYAITAVMGSDGSQSYANLNPVNAAVTLRGTFGRREGGQVMQSLFEDSGESLTADVWNIFYIFESLANQKLLQFKLVNNSGGESNIETTFLRIV